MADASSWWVSDAQQQWSSNNLPRVVEILANHQPGTSGSFTLAKQGSSTLKKDAVDVEPSQSSNAAEFDLAFVHNWALSNFAHSGTIVQLPISLTSRKLTAEEAKEKSARAGTCLDPALYTPHSIEWTLATIGQFNCLGYYNLAVYQFITGHLRGAADVTEHLLEKHHSMFQDSIAIKLALLFLFTQLNLNNLTHPKVQQMTTWLEKSVPAKIDELSKTEAPAGSLVVIPDLLGLLESNVWAHIIRSQLSLLQGKTKASKRELSTLMAATTAWTNCRLVIHAASSGDGSELPPHPTQGVVQMLKSRLLDIRRNQNKAEEDMRDDPSVALYHPAAYHNNMGVLMFHRKKFMSALSHFLQASEQNLSYTQRPGSSNNSLAFPLSNDITSELNYNSALQLMMMRRFADAAKLFEIVSKKSPILNQNPLLWLRLAECLIQTYADTRDSRAHQYRMPLASTGGRVRIVRQSLSSSPTEDTKMLYEAKRHLTHSQLLMETHQGSAWFAQAVFGTNSSTNNQTSLPPNLSVLQSQYRERVARLHCNVLLSWVSLECADYPEALEWAAAARAWTQPPGTSVIVDQQVPQLLHLAMLYFVESALHLGKLDEGMKLLSDALGSNSLPELVGTTNAKVGLYCNLATVHIIRGDYDHAKRALAHAESLDANASHAALVRLFLTLKDGDVATAMQVLRSARLDGGFVVQMYPNKGN